MQHAQQSVHHCGHEPAGQAAVLEVIAHAPQAHHGGAPAIGALHPPLQVQQLLQGVAGLRGRGAFVCSSGGKRGGEWSQEMESGNGVR